MLHRIERLLRKPRAPLWLGLTLIVVCLPCLRVGLQADDVLSPWKLARGASPWSLFEMNPMDLSPVRSESGCALSKAGHRLSQGAHPESTAPASLVAAPAQGYPKPCEFQPRA